jgi:hypothetical protein
MTPEELAKYRQQKVDLERKEQEERQRLQDDAIARRAADEAAAQKAIAEEAVPYLLEVKAAMGNGLTFNVISDTNGQIHGLDMRVDNRGGQIRIVGSSVQAGVLGRVSREYHAFNKIRAPQDITRGNIGEFIKFVMDNDRP